MMRFILDEKFIKNLIGDNFQKQVSLARVVRMENISRKREELFEAEVTVPENVKVRLCDDLLEEGIFKGSCVFILKRGSYLEFDFRVIEKLYTQEIYRKINICLVGEGAEAVARCSCLGMGDQFYKIDTFQHHKASRTKSTFLIKGVFYEQASMLCENLIRVEKGIREIKASEKNKSLLLGDSSRVISVPKLEIKSEDVSCHHGAAISRLNNEHLFYFQSRGMDLAQAKNFLVDAFLN